MAERSIEKRADLEPEHLKMINMFENEIVSELYLPIIDAIESLCGIEKVDG